MKRIGFTSGVFDMFHVGHLNLIENAKKNCDYLIVGVNSDELMIEYKNKKPVIGCDERMRIIAALKCVDEVIKIDTLDKEIVWRKIPFNFLFIGDDWKGSERWNETERIMRTHGVETIYFPYTQTTNSTLLRSKLENNI